MEFEDLKQLKELFASGQFLFPKEMMVTGIHYRTNRTSEYSIEDMIKKNHKAMWVYSTSHREQAQSVGLNHAIIFLWGFVPNTLKMVPYDVRAISIARLSGPITEKSDNGNSVNIPKERIIGDVVDVIITSLPGIQPLKGKVDTGADVSSIHADNWDINNNQVTFMSSDLSENQITMPVIEKQAIKLSNGDVEYRPVIELNIKINEQQLTNCMFNLNDRGAMEYSMLIGQNVLEAGGFIIDPTINDQNVTNEDFEIDWDLLQEDFKDDIVVENNSKFIKDIINFMESSSKK